MPIKTLVVGGLDGDHWGGVGMVLGMTCSQVRRVQGMCAEVVCMDTHCGAVE